MKRLFLLLSFAAAACSVPSQDDMKLWYDEPASAWVEALPVGNGRIGAMVYGVPEREHLQLNEETLWAGQPNSNANGDVTDALADIRNLVFEGRYREAQDMVDAKVFHRTNHGMAYQTPARNSIPTRHIAMKGRLLRRMPSTFMVCPFSPFTGWVATRSVVQR